MSRFALIALLLMVGCNVDDGVRVPISWVANTRWVRGNGQQCCPRVLLICEADGRQVAELERDFEWHLSMTGAAWNKPNLNAFFVDEQHALDAAMKFADQNKLCIE